MKTKNRILSLALAGIMSLSMLVPAFAASATFTDVPTTHWAYAYVEKAVAEGYVTGVGNNRYNPSGTITYAEFCTMLVRAGEEHLLLDEFDDWCERTGNDPENWRQHWYGVYMWTMNFSSLLDGTKAQTDRWVACDSSIAESPLNRYEMAQLMFNMMYNGIIDSTVEVYPDDSEIAAAKNSIADWSSIPANYQEAVATCYAAGFLSGVDSKGTFAGNTTMDRAQAATVMCRLCSIDVSGSSSNNSGSGSQGSGTQTGAVGDKDANGYTTAASVNSVKNRNKSDAYPTKGNSDTVSVNGYYTGSTVDVGDSVLVYDFLDMVNAARKAEGLNELKWVQSDAAEEYTLVRAKDIVINFSHFGQHAGMGQEVIAGGYSAEEVFQSWMNSEGHRATLMRSSDSYKYMSAAKNGTRWIIIMWRDFAVENAENNSDDYLVPVG